jgi:hypothetical protein
METKQLTKVIDTMNVMDRARALQGMHQAVLLVSLADAIVTRVRGALNSSTQAMTLVYGRSGRHQPNTSSRRT